MANEKMTKRDYYTSIIAHLNGEDTTITKGETIFKPSLESMVEFLANEKTLLEKKASNKKPTKTQQDNLVWKEDIYNIIKALGGSRVRSADILKHADCPTSVVSTPKVTTLVGLLKAEGRVVQTTEKGAAYYSIVA